MMAQQKKEGSMTEEQLQEYLDKGGKITICPPGERTEEIDYKGSFYQKRKKKKEDEANKE